MKLLLEVDTAFSSEGALSRTTEKFVPRSGQTTMALAVANSITNAKPLVVEAATGVGKTFSYLVPVLLSGERTLISTATKALQDQLFNRDLPQLVKAFNLPVRTALLKGRNSYLCLHRMDLIRHQDVAHAGAASRSIARVEQWAQVTRTGDLAELPGLDDRSPLIPLITSTRDNCLGSSCPRILSCFVYLARREAMAADVVVINHHLFFADLAIRESGVAELLPSVRVVIFDEAHQLNETGVQFLGKKLTTGQLIDFARDLLAAGLLLARGLADWREVTEAVEMAARELRLCIAHKAVGTKLRWTDAIPEGIAEVEWKKALTAVVNACHQAGALLYTMSEIAPDFIRLHERVALLAERAKSFTQVCDPACVRWIDVGIQLFLVESPLDISSAVATRILRNNGEGSKAWIFTSATLGDDDRLSWFTGPCGLEEAKILRIGSPFDYLQQAALYLPDDFPKPSDPDHSTMVAERTAVWARALGGRTMVLTTTLRALHTIGHYLESEFSRPKDPEVLVQGSMSKRALLARFQQSASQGMKGCVLVGSASFWEGIDLPGSALEMVIIDKIPFPPPSDPLVQARSARLESQGKNPFAHYFLPEAAMSLKQGAGRLIRRESDAGVLVVCDSRLLSMGYGKRLVKALPAMRRLASEGELMDRLQDLTKICTTDSQRS